MVDAYLVEVNIVNTNPSFISWYIDSRASNHVIHNSSILSSFLSNSGFRITSTSAQNHDVIRVGSVAICFLTSEIQKITHVLYSLSIMKNLKFVVFLTNKGDKLDFSREKQIIKDPTSVQLAIALTHKKNGPYKLEGKTLLKYSET